VNPLDSIQDLVGNQEDSLEGKSSFAVLEELFQRRPENISDYHFEIILDSVPVQIGNPCSTLDYSVYFGLSFKRRVFEVNRVDFYCQFLFCTELVSEVNFRFGALADTSRSQVLFVKGKL
jgi:hypothetical protein